jgi:hypothetical protein
VTALTKAVQAAPKPQTPVTVVVIPNEYWELLELVANSCPPEALKVFRKSLIGRGKPLKAREADAAIRCADLGCKPKLRHGDGFIVVPETMEEQLGRLRWYLKCELPVVLARPRGYAYTPQEVGLACAADAGETGLTILEFDETGVDRVPFPFPNPDVEQPQDDQDIAAEDQNPA